MGTYSGFDYYKVPVSGPMSDTNVRLACHSYGLVPMCSGPDGCTFNDHLCTVTPLSTSCYNPMQGLSQHICNGQNPNGCEQTTHLYNYMGENWQSGSSCGTDGSSWCTIGNHQTDRDALCVRAQGECGNQDDVNCEGHWDDWTEC